MKNILAVAFVALIAVNIASAQEGPAQHDEEQVSTNFKKPSYSPYAGRNFPNRVYFGDTHLHTSLSGDAFGFGNNVNDEDALRFARGQEITSAGGIKVKLSRPLDFLVIADHGLGF